MASGKSLELKKIKRHEPEPLCICGKAWALHFRKDGKGMLARYATDDRHQKAGIAPPMIGTGLSGMNRAMRRKMEKHR